MIDWLFITAAHAATAEGGGHGGGHEGGFNPMEQFDIVRYVDIHLGGYDASFTNSSLWMVMGTLLVLGFFMHSMKGGNLVPTRMQSVTELAYEFVANMVRQNAGNAGMAYFPIIFTIFLYVLAMNLLGMIPLPKLGNFTVTSHIIVTFALAMFVWLGVTADRHPQARLQVLQAVRAVGRARAASAAHQRDRDHLLLHPPHQPLRPSVRQHDGRAHHARRVRQLRRGAWHFGRLAPASASWWRSWGSKS